MTYSIGSYLLNFYLFYAFFVSTVHFIHLQIFQFVDGVCKLLILHWLIIDSYV